MRQGQGFPYLKLKPKIESEDYNSENIRSLIFLLIQIRPFKTIWILALNQDHEHGSNVWNCIPVYNKTCILICFLVFFTKHRFVHFVHRNLCNNKQISFLKKSKFHSFFFEKWIQWRKSFWLRSAPYCLIKSVGFLSGIFSPNRDDF